MSRSRAALTALFTVALCFCAFGVANASAANVEAHTCFNAGITAGNTQRYKDSECTETEEPGGTWGWKLIPAGKTQVEVAMGESSTLEATVGGATFKMACTTLEGDGEVENAGGKMLGSELVLTYKGCTVIAPTGSRCAVATTLHTNSLKFASNEMKVKYEPEGANFITINVTQGTGLTCPAAILGNHNVTGQATAVVPEMGNIQEFTETSGSGLEFGGQAAKYLGKNSLHMLGTTNTIGAVTP